MLQKDKGGARDQDGPPPSPPGSVQILVIIDLFSCMFVLLLLLNCLYTLHTLFCMPGIFHKKLFTIPSFQNAKKIKFPFFREAWHQK